MEEEPLEISDFKVLPQNFGDEPSFESSTKDKKIHKCDECGSSFTQVGNLKTHQLSVHRGVTRFKCSICKYVTFHKTSLKKHLLVHTGETPYKSNTCDHACKEASSLKRHQKAHIGVRFRPQSLHKCEDCNNYYTKSLSGLQRHMSQHSDSGEFRCPLCESQYKSLIGLRHHVLDHTRKAP